ncbi:unnamed protein product [Rotaria sp. Silwood1]|nr:unnamed protein product [Rotaria sp. Silwood1]
MNTTAPATTNCNHQSASHEKCTKELARSILLCDEIAFTKTKLSHCVPLWKRKTDLHEAAIELLLNKKLIKPYEKAATQTATRRTLNVWLKCVPKSLDLTHLNEFQKSLAEFNITWDTFQRTLQKFQPPTGVIINDELANLLKSQQYQTYIQFDVDSLTKISDNANHDQTNEEQNNSSHSCNATNDPMVVNDSTIPIGASTSILQQSSRFNSITTSIPIVTRMSSGTSISNEIPIQQAEIFNQAPSSNIPTVPQFRLPRPIDLAATRREKTASKKTRVNNEKPT